MYKIELKWKESVKINLSIVNAKLKLDHPECVGIQAHDLLEVWFSSEPSQEAKNEIEAYWHGLNADSDEAKSYKSQEDIKAEADAKKASAMAKLAALGLSAEELKAILG